MYFVCRQHNYPDGDFAVEISHGVDTASPDMIMPKKEWKALGDGQTFSDPREAVEAAIKLRDAWMPLLKQDAMCVCECDKSMHNADDGSCMSEGCTCDGFLIAIQGCFGDMGVEELRLNALRAWGQMPTCMNCGELIDVSDKKHTADPEDEDSLYCSDDCLQKGMEFQQLEHEHIEMEENKGIDEEADRFMEEDNA